ncbi:MAG: fibronectin type III domain-containing protein, partial [Cyclobacteriaceae bacterium]|nr:fibronectin type III domain-containing protein [Cyclobacteriaceae bacterium]
MKKTALIFALLIITCRIVAQNYPIQSNITITPPYSVYLSDYASISSNKLMVNMMLKDPMEPRVDITLRVTIKGNGIELRTRDDYRPQPIELNGGVPLILSGPDLESYLNPANLTFSGISKNEFVKTGKLPEGVYQFSVEAMSFDRPGIVLSNAGMTVGWLVLNDPPHWTLPMQNSLLTATYPQFVNFSWMPMNTGSPNAAFTTEYEFTIVELWPEDRAPGDAINSFAPLYQTVTSNTSLVYGPAEPELTPGRKYVCRLRAYDTEGRDLFKNNGYSEILVFTFGQACMPPNTFSDRIISPEEARVEWTSLPGNTQFTLSYSEQNADGTWSTWYHNEGIMPYSNLKDLKPGSKYRYQLKALCGTIESKYSEIKEFATPAADTAEIVCGKGAGVPDIDDSPPLPTLRIGDRINAGGFTALVTEAEGSNGSFTGKCILFVKTFGHAPIYSEFTNIGVNQSMQLTSGSIKSVKGELKIHSVDSVLADLNDMLAGDDDSDTDSNGDPNVGDPYEDGDSIIVTLGGEDFIITGDTTIITAGGDTIVTDFSQVPPIIVVNGDSTDVTTDELDFDGTGGTGDNSDVASNVSDTAAYAITLVKFKRAKNQFFGFDQYPEDISAFQADYSKEKVNKKDYPVHWKSTQSNGMNDKVVMEITTGVPDSIRTRLTIESSVSGPLNYNFNAKDSIWEVIVTGQPHENEDHIIAYYTQDDGTRIAVGHLNLVSYNKQNMKLVIVPVNNDYTVEARALKDSLDNIYKGAITFWDVSVAARLNVDFEENDVEGLDTELPDMAAFTKEMRDIRSALKDQSYFDGNAQYLFLVAKS